MKFRRKFILLLLVCLGLGAGILFAVLPNFSASAAAPQKASEPNSLPCLKKGGTMVVAKLRTDLLPLPMDYRVYLPPCYEQQINRRYPVLVLVHGQSYTDDQWDRLGADETLDELVADGEISPFILVMPRDRYGGQPTENNFARVVVEDLFPVLEQEYRFKPGREYRAVGGLSRGAGWAVHLATVYWQKFSILGAHSPAVFHTDAQKMRSWLDSIPAGMRPVVYVDIGERDRPEILESAHWFESVLDEKDIPHQWRLFTGYHSEAYWQSHMRQYLRWYAENW